MFVNNAATIIDLVIEFYSDHVAISIVAHAVRAKNREDRKPDLYRIICCNISNTVSAIVCRTDF